MLFIGEVETCAYQNVAPLVWRGDRTRLSQAHPERYEG
jgi:hypothetical protein